jgi:hypothetical protein
MPVAAAVVLACSSGLQAAPGEAGPLRVIPPHSIIHDETIGEWGARWWQWMALSPKGTNPVRDDRTGELAHVGQTGWSGQPSTLECHPGSAAPVFFLAGNFGGTDTRTVTVPGGREILVPLFGSVQYNLRDREFSVGELAERARAEVDRVDTLELTLDGRVIAGEELRDHRELFRIFKMCLPWNNVQEHQPGEYYPAVSDGYFLMLEPPPPGAYTIRWQVSAGGCSAFCTDMTYRIEVAESKLIRGDADGTARVNITDVIVILEHLFLGRSGLGCLDGADTDDSGVIDISDAVLLLNQQFRGGNPLPPPFPECGTDPTDDALGMCTTRCEF